MKRTLSLLSSFYRDIFPHQQEKELRYWACLHMNVCVCAGAHVYWVDVNMYEHVLRPKDTLRCHSLSVTYLVFGDRASQRPGNHRVS